MRPASIRSSIERVLLVVSMLAATAWVTGCTSHIGDKCTLSTDCSLKNDRICDTSEPGGYCTIENCAADLCPDNASCIQFNVALQGCGYTDRGPSRTSRSYCMKTCTSNSNCRDGYVCADPTGSPWNAAILEANQSERVCIVAPDQSATSVTIGYDPDAAVCQSEGPTVPGIDASTNEVDASFEEDAAAIEAGEGGEGEDAALIDAAIDATILLDAGVDATILDGGVEAATDAGDGG